MRLISVETENLGAPGVRRLDLRDLPDGVIAVVGENGTGKTTFLEASCPGVLFRTFPSRSPSNPVDLVAGRHGRVEAVFEDGGHEWRLLHTLDGQARKVDAHIYRDGVPYGDGDLTSTGRARVFDALVAQIWPAWPVVSASRYLVQRGVGSWQSADAPERRQMLAKLLGLDRLQQIADRAAQGQRDAERRLETLRSEEAAAAQRVDDLRQLSLAIEETSELLEQSHSDLTTARLSLERVDVDVRTATLAQDARTAAERLEERTELEDAIQRSRREAESVRGDVDALQRDNDAAFAEATAARVAARESAAELARWQQLERARMRAAQLVDRLAATATGGAQAEPSELEAQLEDARAEAASEEALREKGRRLAVKVANLNTRYTSLAKYAGALGDVPCGGEGEFEGCPLIAQAVDARGHMPALRDELAEAEAELAQLPPCSDATVERAHRRVEELRTALRRAVADQEQRAAYERAQDDLARAAAEVPPEPEAVSSDDAERRLQKCASVLAAAEATLQREQARAETLQRQLDRLPSAEELRAQAAGSGWEGEPLDELLRRQYRFRRSVGSLEAQVARFEERLSSQRARLDEFDGCQRQLADIGRRIHVLSGDVARLKRLRYGFGPRGVQGVLAESAGPAIAAVANELLEHACDGPRWQLDIRTRRDNQTGDGQRDVAECTVYDAERDAEGLLENVSGGELDLLASALALGFAAHHSAVSGTRWETLWLDEAGSALTREAAARWVSMLRKALPLLGVRQALIVTHDKEVQRGADAIVDVAELEVEPC